MSYLDLDSLTPPDLILQYVVEQRGQGFFVPYLDHDVITEWLTVCPDVDLLLLVLSEVLPGYFDKARAQGKRPGSLAGVKLTVLRRLREQGMRAAAGTESRREPQ